jgi:riboflavin biosynthesis pyrimidine reductase
VSNLNREGVFRINIGVSKETFNNISHSNTEDVRVSGGANTIQQYLRAGLVDEFTIHYSPVFFGGDISLYVDITLDIQAKIKEAIPYTRLKTVTWWQCMGK